LSKVKKSITKKLLKLEKQQNPPGFDKTLEKLSDIKDLLSQKLETADPNNISLLHLEENEV